MESIWHLPLILSLSGCVEIPVSCDATAAASEFADTKSPLPFEFSIDGDAPLPSWSSSSGISWITGSSAGNITTSSSSSKIGMRSLLLVNAIEVDPSSCLICISTALSSVEISPRLDAFIFDSSNVSDA